MAKKILILPGDGIGPEVTDAAVSVLKAVSEDLDIDYGDIGTSAYDKYEKYLPSETVEKATESNAIITGPINDRVTDPLYRNPIRELKKNLDLYAVKRKFFPLFTEPCTKRLDIILITGNPDVLMGLNEIESLDGVSFDRFLSINSCKKIFNITKLVAQYKNRSKITCVHRKGMLPVTDGLFTDLFYKEFEGTDFQLELKDISAISSDLVSDPRCEDVIVTTDMHGAALAGLCAGLVGGSYLTPVGSLGSKCGLFEPMHGTRNELIENGVANPTSAILSSAMALDYCKMDEEAEKIRQSVRTAYRHNIRTPDVGGTKSTQEFTDYVIHLIEQSK